MEKRYESDLTQKEKWQLEWKKIKELEGSERLDYLWTYYKYMLVVLAIVVSFIGIVCSMIRGKMTDQLLVVGIMNTNYEKENELEALQDELMTILDTEKKWEEVSFDTSLTYDLEDYYAMMKFNTMVTAGDMDVVICGQEAVENLQEQGALDEWEEFLGADYAKYEPYMTEFGLELSQSEKWDRYWDFSNPTYAVLMYSSENPEGVRALLAYFFPDAE